MHSLIHQELARARQAEILASRSHHGGVRPARAEQRRPRPVLNWLRGLRAALARS